MEYLNKQKRPWGWFAVIDGSDLSGYKIKKICVYPGHRLSLQSHSKRSEHWTIVEGVASVQVGNDKHILSRNQSIYIPTGTLHRIHNTNNVNIEIIEIQIGEYLGEDDIKRYEDDYNRI
jgi:mannose-6-phosphate isomerase-like protein (cupin superfamily)